MKDFKYAIAVGKTRGFDEGVLQFAEERLREKEARKIKPSKGPLDF